MLFRLIMFFMSLFKEKDEIIKVEFTYKKPSIGYVRMVRIKKDEENARLAKLLKRIRKKMRKKIVPPTRVVNIILHFVTRKIVKYIKDTSNFA